METIPKISDESKKRIKKIVKFHYGFIPTDDEIYNIDQGLRNNYVTLHDQFIIREIVTRNISEKILLKHRTKENVLEIEGLFLNKLIFHYLTYASMCYRAGIPLATIHLCRTAMEAGLRERIAEERAKRKVYGNATYQKEVWNEIGELKRVLLKKLIPIAEEEGVITEAEIEKIFMVDEKGKPIIYKHRHLLDKYIHADLSTLIDFFEAIGMDEEVIGAEDFLKEMKIKAEIWTNEIAFIILKATTRLAERLYLMKYPIKKGSA